ncbi:MAG TPA: hypothetical protein VFC53_08780 [Dehalococcoidia bacterium]|nr:hypothetical protein [Dehalococcoidia bacterium]
MVTISERGTLLEDTRFEDAIRDLLSLKEEEGVLSVYLDLDPDVTQRGGHEARLIDLWKPLRQRPVSQWMRGRLEYEIDAVMADVRGWRQAPGRAVAMFYSGPAGVRMTLPLDFPIRSLARFEARPLLAPLLAALDAHRRYAVVLFDHARARIITVFLGRVEEEVVLHADVLPHSRVGGFGGYLDKRYAQYREEQIDAHARRTIEHLWAIDGTTHLRTLVLAGPEEALASLRKAMPAQLARAVAATLHLDLDVSTAEVVRHVESVEAVVRRREDEKLVHDLIDLAHRGKAAIGWDETLQALAEGRVHALVLPRDETRAGVQCPEGHFAATPKLDCCPICGEKLWETDDVAEAALRAALLHDAHVRFVGNGAAELLAGRGPVAQLRY